MPDIIYAIETNRLSHGNLTVREIKIGKTTNLNSTLAQYNRLNMSVEVLDIWKPNSAIKTSECEKGVLNVAEKYAHERDSETFRFLQNGYENFAENISSILVHTSMEELKEGTAQDADETEEDVRDEEKENYTGEKPEFFVLNEDYCEVNSWRELLEKLAKKIYDDNDNFDKILQIEGRKRNYFSKGPPKSMRKPEKIEGTPYYCETNFSSNQTMDIVKRLLEKFNYSDSDFRLGLQ